MGAWISGWRYVYVYIRARANQVMKKWKPSGAVMEIGDASLLPFGMPFSVPPRGASFEWLRMHV
jgi:hypothetical protein